MRSEQIRERRLILMAAYWFGKCMAAREDAERNMSLDYWADRCKGVEWANEQMRRLIRDSGTHEMQLQLDEILSGKRSST